MSFQLPGRLDVRALGDAQRQNIEMQQFAYQGLANLGDQIKKNIEIENARKDALRKQPEMIDSYSKGFTLIENGKIPEGMKMIYGATSIAQGNPLLEKIAQDANQSANILLRSKMESQLLNQKQDFNAYENEQNRMARAGNAAMRAANSAASREKETSPAKRAEQTNEFYGKQDEFLLKIASSKTPSEYKKNVKAFNDVYDSYLNAGANVQLAEIPPYIPVEVAKKLKQKESDFEKMSLRYANNPNEFLKKQLKKTQKDLDDLRKQEISAQSVIESSRSPISRQQAPSGVAEGTRAINKQTGQQIVFQNGQWITVK